MSVWLYIVCVHFQAPMGELSCKECMDCKPKRFTFWSCRGKTASLWDKLMESGGGWGLQQLKLFNITNRLRSEMASLQAARKNCLVEERKEKGEGGTRLSVEQVCKLCGAQVALHTGIKKAESAYVPTN